MRKIFISAVFVCLSVMCVSCFTRDQMGYPEKVTFPKEGGKITVTGDILFHNLDISDYDGNSDSDIANVYYDKENDRYYCEDATGKISDTMTVSFRWLKAEIPVNEKKVILTAEPLSGKPRKLYLHNFYGPGYIEIVVKQK